MADKLLVIIVEGSFFYTVTTALGLLVLSRVLHWLPQLSSLLLLVVAMSFCLIFLVLCPQRHDPQVFYFLIKQRSSPVLPCWTISLRSTLLPLFCVWRPLAILNSTHLSTLFQKAHPAPHSQLQYVFNSTNVTNLNYSYFFSMSPPSDQEIRNAVRDA